ncbi:ABC transporter ATP-binding protein [Salmonella enterica subsp. diarizonae]|uniref:ABC transporter ATP-binding protein n=1 Tax=Salmonella enterica TaxID=28901 RepID=UPI0009AD24F4|nr:ABC transporter ATP-binding protein [Salmonella enterica]EAW2451701.1 ABC transporter ATP-binding protein [Salmonella enterica subsp. diarizonae]EHG2955303.1 ABC transporter ATP-binding protein [Salmonella enterica subsp. diarizonae serovar 53:r:z35]EHG6070532.1 ABC transporter ATP-binding protein [Salmonella enterica subsp. diarizonae serovar 61:z52:z53]ECI5215308.1 ATP-binding cassette domain-containing protein [Salmonella enterica subsp. diarizonae]EDL8432138.1 ABC transporter ATP-bindin
MSEIALRLHNVYVAYGNSQQPVLNGFTMSVHQGEIACLLGASGCGKTTVLRAVAGFERLQQGEIYVSQRRVAAPDVHLPPEKRQVGMVFQEYALFPHLTAHQNIAFGLRRMPREKQQARVMELLKMVELHSHANRYPYELSGGQQQRIALARALAPSPEILLLDEPFSSLDKRTRERLGNEVRDILRADGQTALLVTHSEHEAQLMADHIGVVKMGQYQIKKAALLS